MIQKELFLKRRYLSFKDLGLHTGIDLPIINAGNITFYHYTRVDRLSLILNDGGGLRAWRRVACPSPPEELINSFLIEGFLSPLPDWLIKSTYYSDLGYELTKKYIGKLLLEVTIPISQYTIYVSEYSHILECKALEHGKGYGLAIGYDCSNGRESTQAYVNSYIPIQNYLRHHHAPIIQVINNEEGIIIPSNYIKICELQPLKDLNEEGDFS
ncbi:hypothetical protein ACF3MZ_10910 [Paenibacillaceae bacterium WGS1546]|uniref:hypothetical protein n=1 Tax=Cohnella sp. WGS1546 TaxID=3366810 RepID=UPI00372D7078